MAENAYYMQLVPCECGETYMTLDSFCKKCGKDRAKGSGKRVVEKFIEEFKNLPPREKPEAIAEITALISKWIEMFD